MLRKLERALNSAEIQFKVDHVEGQPGVVAVYVVVNGTPLTAFGVKEEKIQEFIDTVLSNKG